jgi:hypothetical protein
MEQLRIHTAREKLQELQGPQPTVVGFEGGPCGGKTTLANSVIESAYNANRNVVMLEEVASKHINALQAQGIDFFDLLQNDRQAFLEIEVAILKDIHSAIDEARRKHAGTNTIILADRTTVKPYMSAEEYAWVIKEAGLYGDPYLHLVDTMIYLPSVAREDAELYDKLKATNPARYEPSHVAKAICEANFNAIKDHPELHVFWGGSFEDKIAEATEIIMHPEREIEPKFVPLDMAIFEAFLEDTIASGNYIELTDIEQSYHDIDGTEARLRRITTTTGENVHFCSFKEVVTPTEKRERRRTISEKDYRLLQNTQVLGSLEKKRHSFFVTDPQTSKRLVWVADEYDTPKGRLWNIEVELPNAKMLSNLYFPIGLQPVEYSARDLAIAKVA